MAIAIAIAMDWQRNNSSGQGDRHRQTGFMAYRPSPCKVVKLLENPQQTCATLVVAPRPLQRGTARWVHQRSNGLIH